MPLLTFCDDDVRLPWSSQPYVCVVINYDDYEVTLVYTQKNCCIFV